MQQKGFSNFFIVIVIAITAIAASGYFALEKNTKPISESSPTVPSMKELKKESTPKPKVEPKLKTLLTPDKGLNKEQNYVGKTQQSRDPWKDPVPAAPINLALPILVKDINVTDVLLSPYGIIRKSGDGGIGHGGIDFPLERSSPVYAVADGTVLKNDLEDPGGGNTVDVLILATYPGEGWIFKYDHIALEPGLTVGSGVQKGQKIGTNALQQRGNNHIGLEYHIRNFTIAREKICWVDRLESNVKQQLRDAFNGMKKIPAFLQSWQTANEEGHYQYRGLLDETKYPNGPQLCYTLGTDARIPIN